MKEANMEELGKLVIYLSLNQSELGGESRAIYTKHCSREEGQDFLKQFVTWNSGIDKTLFYATWTHKESFYV